MKLKKERRQHHNTGGHEEKMARRKALRNHRVSNIRYRINSGKAKGNVDIVRDRW